MSDVANNQPARSVIRTCGLALVGVVILVAGLGGLLYLGRLQSAAEIERNQQRREAESFAQVKSGDSRVTVYGRPKILELLADDATCTQNLQSIGFFVCDLGEPGFATTAELTNVCDLWIYDCRNSEEFLDTVRGMPSIESISFESIFVNERLFKSLANFPNLKRVRFERRLDAPDIELLSQIIPGVIIEFEEASGGTVQMGPSAGE
jgi:hypothetical protein